MSDVTLFVRFRGHRTKMFHVKHFGAIGAKNIACHLTGTGFAKVRMCRKTVFPAISGIAARRAPSDPTRPWKIDVKALIYCAPDFCKTKAADFRAALQ
jgi:hypothetical protein